MRWKPLVATFLLVCWAIAASGRLQASVVAYWPMDEGTGTTTADEASATYNGTFNTNGGSGPTWTTGKFGNGLALADLDYIDTGVASQTGLNFSGTSPFSISAWITRNNVGSYDCIVGKDSYGTNTGYSLWVYTDNKVTFRFGSQLLQSVRTVTNDGNWHLIVASFDGATRRIYLDGALEASAGGTLLPAPSLHAYLGTPADAVGNINYGLNGKIDDVAIWDTALVQSDVDTLWNGGSGLAASYAVTPVPEPLSLQLWLGVLAFAVLFRLRIVRAWCGRPRVPNCGPAAWSR